MSRMPFGELMRMTLMGTAERLSAKRAHEIGLVSEVVAGERLLQAAREVAATIASHPPRAVQATVRTLWAARELSRHQALDMSKVLVRLGSNAESLFEGQQRFASGNRIEWRLR